MPLSEVLYFKAELKYVTVRTAQRTFILDGSLADLEAQHEDEFLELLYRSEAAEIRSMILEEEVRLLT